jgi:hypothetical protein
MLLSPFQLRTFSNQPSSRRDDAIAENSYLPIYDHATLPPGGMAYRQPQLKAFGLFVPIGGLIFRSNLTWTRKSEL